MDDFNDDDGMQCKQQDDWLFGCAMLLLPSFADR
jgi:hypothetical protein